MCTSGMCVFVAVCVHGTCSWCVYIPGVCTFLVCVCYWSMHVPGVCVSLVCACPWCVHVPDVCMLVVSVLLGYARACSPLPSVPQASRPEHPLGPNAAQLHRGPVRGAFASLKTSSRVLLATPCPQAGEWQHSQDGPVTPRKAGSEKRHRETTSMGQQRGRVGAEPPAVGHPCDRREPLTCHAHGPTYCLHTHTPGTCIDE